MFEHACGTLGWTRAAGTCIAAARGVRPKLRKYSWSKLVGAAWLLASAAARGFRTRNIALPQPATSVATLTPAKALDARGAPRKVGVEIEFAELDLDSASRTIQALFGGEIERLTEYEQRVRDTTLGTFQVELDSHTLKTLAKKRRRGLPLRWFEQLNGLVRDAAAETFTPNELSTAPISFDQLPEIDRLVHALGRAGAAGTDDSLLSQLGVHFNPTLPSHDPRVLRDYIRAYALLHDELVEALHVDPTRLAVGWATGYPSAYVRKVLAHDYDPTLEQLIDDYLEHNPTRNRALDMMPAFAHLDRERVLRAARDPRISERPTFHFRLPNSEVSNPAWTVTEQWQLWLEVERLACDPERLAALSGDALRRFQLPWQSLRTRWNALSQGAMRASGSTR